MAPGQVVTTYGITWGRDGRPKLHKTGCADIVRAESQGRSTSSIQAATLTEAIWDAGAEQRQFNDDPDDLDEDPGVDVMKCLDVTAKS